MNLKRFQRDCLLGALGWFLMLIGDLCLSVIPASQNDISLFAREAYLSGAWEPWRLPLLTVTGLCGMALGFFSVRASVDVILPPYRKTRIAALIGGVMVVATAAAMHFCVGSMADWTTVLAPMIGRDETAMLIAAQFSRLLPVMSVGYIGLALMIGTSFFAVATKKNHAAALDDGAAHRRFPADFRRNSGHPADAGHGNFDVGLCAQPRLHQRGAVHLDAGERGLGDA